MPFYAEFVCQAIFFSVTQVLVVCVLFPWFILPFSIILVVFVGLDIVMGVGMLETKKLENKTKSPLLHHLNSAMSGITVIRGYQRQNLFQVN